MYNTFISVVGIIPDSTYVLKSVLSKTHKVLKESFQDFEIILVNNGLSYDFDNALTDLEDIYSHIRVLNLSKSIDSNNAIVAGLDHANGDYIIVMDMDVFPELIAELYQKTQENNDVVYVRFRDRKMPFLKKSIFKLFYYIMDKYSDIQIDFNMSDTRIISRRALNSILRVREKMRYMKGIYSFVGYRTSFIEINSPVGNSSKRSPSYSQLLTTAISAITSFTDIAHKLLLYVFFASLIFCVGASVNAMSVKFLGFDIFGNPTPNVPGYTFLIVFLAITFSLNILVLYVFSIFLFSINREIKDRPIYILESIQRLEDKKPLTNGKRNGEADAKK
jgi:glycosyltransferase involved in cell wall biosynthesis